MRALAVLSLAVAAVFACSSFTSVPGTSPGNDAGVGSDGGFVEPVPDGASSEDDGAARAVVSAAYRAAVLEDLPAGYWRMDTAAGFTVPDETGRGHSLTLSGGHIVVPGAVPGSNGLRFDGIGSMATVEGILDAKGKTPYTVECWIQLDGAFDGGAGVQYRVLWSQATNAGDNIQNGVLSYFARETGDVWQLVSGRSNGMVHEGPFAAGNYLDRFLHIVTSYEDASGTLKLYIDGVEHGRPSAVTIPAQPTALLIGRSDFGGFFPGIIDEVAVYDHALPLARIQAHRLAAGKVP